MAEWTIVVVRHPKAIACQYSYYASTKEGDYVSGPDGTMMCYDQQEAVKGAVERIAYYNTLKTGFQVTDTEWRYTHHD